MNHMRRHFLSTGAAAALCVALPALAQTAASSDQPIKLVVGFPPGQATDIVARLLAPRISAAFGQPVVVENKPGQGGSLALAQVAKSAPDGQTVAIAATAAMVVNAHLYRSVGYDTLKDFVAAGTVAELPMLLVAHTAMPFNTFQELVAHAKKNAGAMRFGSSGNGTLSHLAMELLQRDTGTKLLHVPYKGSVPAMTDLASGNLDVALDTYAAVLPHLQAKRIKLIATATAQRLPLTPDTPTIAESGLPGFTSSPWLGMLFPQGTPAPIVNRLNAELVKALADPDVVQKLRAVGAVPRPSSAGDMAGLLEKENQSWGRVVRESGAKVD